MTDVEAVDKLHELLRTVDGNPRLALMIACWLPDCSKETRRSLWLVLDDMRRFRDPLIRRDLLPLAFMLGFA